MQRLVSQSQQNSLRFSQLISGLVSLVSSASGEPALEHQHWRHQSTMPTPTWHGLISGASPIVAPLSVLTRHVSLKVEE